MWLLAEAGKVKPQYEAGGLEPGKFKFNGYVPFVVITIWSQDIFLIPK
jgi:hypothetical protein